MWIRDITNNTESAAHKHTNWKRALKKNVIFTSTIGICSVIICNIHGAYSNTKIILVFNTFDQVRVFYKL